MIDNINTLQMNKTRLMDMQEALRRTLKRLRLQASAKDPGRLFQSRTIRIGKEYLYGLHFAGLTYSLYGWLARVELHLVSSKSRQSYVCSCQKRSYNIQLKKETICVFRVQATSVSLNDLLIPSHHVFAREQAERLFTELFLKLAHLQPNKGSRTEQHIQEPGAQEICMTQRTHRDSTSPLFCEPNPIICQPY